MTVVFAAASFLCIGVERDLSSVWDRDFEFHREHLKPSIYSAILQVLLAILLSYGVAVYQTAELNYKGDLLFLIAPFIVSTYAFLLTVSMFAITWKHVSLLTKLARTIEINLLNMDKLLNIANPLLRALAIIVLVFCGTLPSFYYNPNDQLLNVFIYPFLFATVFITIAAFGSPMFALRQRIRTLKQSELDKIQKVYSGDKEAIHELHLHHIAENARPDILTYERRIRETWEWPVGANWERLVLFGLLPPLTWVLAAIVENMVAALM